MLTLQSNQQWGHAYSDMGEDAMKLIGIGPAFGMVDEHDICIACAGVWQQEPHRGLAWALISDNMGADFLSFHKHVLAFLRSTDLQRVEMAVKTDNEQDIRWARMLGFKLEGLMHCYFPDGSDAFLFARVK